MVKYVYISSWTLDTSVKQ